MRGAVWRQMLCAMWQISVAARLSPSLEHQEEENIWQVIKLCEEKGKPEKKKKKVNSCLFIFSLIYGWLCVCVRLCVCESARACVCVRVSSSRALVYLFEPSLFLFWLSCLASSVALN